MKKRKQSIKSIQRGSPAEHLRYMLDVGLQYAPAEGIEAAARALVPHLGAFTCTREDADCRPGACNCDGAHDALAYAIEMHRAGRSFTSD